MSYEVSIQSTDTDRTGVFQDIERTLAIIVGDDARDPLDNDDLVLKQATPMAPVHTLATTVHEDGNSHNFGIYMPIRRSLITAVDATAVTVVDADPFHVGDVVHSIDATGPVTGGGIASGIVTAVNYVTNIVTVQNTMAAGANGDWLEVLENGVATPNVPTRYMLPMTCGLLAGQVDVRYALDDSTGKDTPAAIVYHGAINEGDINFSDDATDDIILVVQLGSWVTGGGVTIITSVYGDESVNVPDWTGTS